MIRLHLVRDLQPRLARVDLLRQRLELRDRGVELLLRVQSTAPARRTAAGTVRAACACKLPRPSDHPGARRRSDPDEDRFREAAVDVRRRAELFRIDGADFLEQHARISGWTGSPPACRDLLDHGVKTILCRRGLRSRDGRQSENSGDECQSVHAGILQPSLAEDPAVLQCSCPCDCASDLQAWILQTRHSTKRPRSKNSSGCATRSRPRGARAWRNPTSSISSSRGSRSQRARSTASEPERPAAGPAIELPVPSPVGELLTLTPAPEPPVEMAEPLLPSSPLPSSTPTVSTIAAPDEPAPRPASQPRRHSANRIVGTLAVAAVALIAVLTYWSRGPSTRVVEAPANTVQAPAPAVQAAPHSHSHSHSCARTTRAGCCGERGTANAAAGVDASHRGRAETARRHRSCR